MTAERQENERTQPFQPWLRKVPIYLPERKQVLFFSAVVLLTLVTACLWWRCTTFDFVYDDHAQIQVNPRIQSVSYVHELLTQPLWEQLGPHRASHYYRPAFSLLLLSQYLLFGLNPVAWHFISLALYVLVTLSVFLLLWLLFDMILPALGGSLLFAVTPIHAEVVSWVSASDESLFSLFLLLSLCSLAAADKTTTQRSRLLWVSLAAILFGFSLAAKETAMGAGLILVAFGLIQSRRRRRTAIDATLVYFVPATLYLIVRWLVLGGTTLPDQPRTLLTVVSLLPSLALLSIRQLLWPGNLSFFYDVKPVVNGWVLAAGVAAILLAATCMYQAYKKAPIWLWIISVLFFPLLPWLIALFYLSDSVLFQNRYLFLPSLAVAVSAAFLLSRIPNRPSAKWAFSTGFLVLCVAMALEAHKAMSLFENDIVLLRRSVNVAPQNVAAWGLLGDAEAKMGDDHNARLFYQKAVALQPDRWDTNFHLAMDYLKHGRKEDAHESLRKSLASQFAKPAERALSWFEMGRIEAAEGRTSDAEHSFLEAEKLEPSSKKVQAELAKLTEGHISGQPN